MKIRLTVLCLMFLAVLLLFAQGGRGSIVGTITDTSGAVVPGVQITAVHTASGARYTVQGNSVGQYLLPNLPVGEYKLTFELQGFKKVTWPGIDVSVTTVRRVDVKLEPGAVTESVEVSAAAPRLQTDSANVGTTLGARDLTSLALAIGNSGRMIEWLAFGIMPGVTGDPRYTTSSRLSGTATNSQEALLDGATVSMDTGNGFSKISLEAVSEFNFQMSGISAEYGRTQAAVSSIVMKSGANEIHGSGFGAVFNEAFNGLGYWPKYLGTSKPVVRQFNEAGSFGGPVYIPKIYNGRNKTFFYGSVEKYMVRNRNSMALSTIPLPEMYDGNMSRLLQGKIVGTDALGNSIAQGAIYDPATFRQLDSGLWVGDMFPGNIIPTSRISKVSRNLNAIAKANYIPNVKDSTGNYPITNNYLNLAAASYKTDQYYYSLKIDHYFSAKHKLSASYTHNIVDSDALSGLLNSDLERGGPLASTSHTWAPSKYPRVSLDSTLRPTILNQFRVYVNRNINSILPNDQTNQAATLGISNLVSMGYPAINWGSGAVTSFTNPGTGSLWYVGSTSWGAADTVNFNKGRHFMKAGYDFRRTFSNRRKYPAPSLAFSATATSIPGSSLAGSQIGHAFASYLLGIVNSASLSGSISTGVRKSFHALFLQDDFKVSPRLTLNLGVRWEYQPPMTEVADRSVSWNPAKIDPASGLPGAYDFAGTCSACTGQRYFGKKDWNNFSPRLGLAYRVGKGFVIRAAYGITYEGDVDNMGLSASAYNPFAWVGTYSLGANTTQPWTGLFQWDNGFPTDRYIPPSMDVSYGSKSTPFMLDPNYGISGYVQTWNFNIQRELPKRTLVEVGYVANKGTGLKNGKLAAVNQLPTSVLAKYGPYLSSSVTSAADAAKYGIAYPYAGFKGTVAGALRPYPQVYGTSTVSVVGAPLGFSTYHSMQVIVNRQFSKGLSVYANYVLSKNLSNMDTAEEWTNSGPIDYYNLALQKAITNLDQTHVVKAYANYDLPFGRGKAVLPGAGKFLNLLVGGWSASLIANYASPTPLAFTTNKTIPGWNGGAYPVNIAEGNLRSPSFDKNSMLPIAYADWNTSPKTMAINTSLVSDSVGYSLGTAGIRTAQIRGFWARNENISLQKSFTIAEKYRLQIRADAFNALHRHTFNPPVTNISAVNFGRISSIGGYRSMQLVARFDF
jgi:hypothetical protein